MSSYKEHLKVKMRTDELSKIWILTLVQLDLLIFNWSLDKFPEY